MGSVCCMHGVCCVKKQREPEKHILKTLMMIMMIVAVKLFKIVPFCSNLCETAAAKNNRSKTTVFGDFLRLRHRREACFKVI